MLDSSATPVVWKLRLETATIQKSTRSLCTHQVEQLKAMSMNYLPYVSWGVYGGTTKLAVATQAHFFASWGLMQTFSSATFNWLKSWYWWSPPYG